MDKVFASLEERLVPLAERIVGALEEAGEPRRTVRKPFDEALLLEGVNGPPPAGVLLAQAAAPKRESNPEVQQLQADFDAVLKQRSELRAQLIVANERLESAEAALARAHSDRHSQEIEFRRRTETERMRTRQLWEERVAKLQAEKALLRKALGANAPSEDELRYLLRQVVSTELRVATEASKQAVQQRLEQLDSRCKATQAALEQAESQHATEVEVLRASLRRAESLLHEQWEHGFVAGLKQAAEALSDCGALDDASARALRGSRQEQTAASMHHIAMQREMHAQRASMVHARAQTDIGLGGCHCVGGSAPVEFGAQSAGRPSVFGVSCCEGMRAHPCEVQPARQAESEHAAVSACSAPLESGRRRDLLEQQQLPPRQPQQHDQHPQLKPQSNHQPNRDPHTQIRQESHRGLHHEPCDHQEQLQRLQSQPQTPQHMPQQKMPARSPQTEQQVHRSPSPPPSSLPPLQSAPTQQLEQRILQQSLLPDAAQWTKHEAAASMPAAALTDAHSGCCSTGNSTSHSASAFAPANEPKIGTEPTLHNSGSVVNPSRVRIEREAAALRYKGF